MKHLLISFLPIIMLLTACIPSEIRGKTEDDEIIVMQFYSGGSALDDLVIHKGINYFGKSQYQIGDPLGDIGFRFNNGKRVQAGCILVGTDFLGLEECKRYKIYHSSWEKVPAGAIFDRPKTY